MKNKLFLFAIALIATNLAYATPPTKDFLCEDKSGNQLAWDVNNYDLTGEVQSIHSDLILTINGIKYTLPTDTALAAPGQPLLLLIGEESQSVIIKPLGAVYYQGNDIFGSAEAEVTVKGPKGLIKKKMRLKCHGFNDA